MGTFDAFLRGLVGNAAANKVVNRRTDWTGAAFRLTGNAVPKGYLESGYYRLRRVDPDGNWHLHYLGMEMPTDEPVYVWDGTPGREVSAIPSTVFPKRAFLLWGVGGTAIWTFINVFIMFGGLSSGMNVLFWAFGLVATLGTPLWQWFYAIEPVRASKYGAVILAVTAAHQAQRQHESEQARQKQATMWNQTQADPWPGAANPRPAEQPQFGGECAQCQGSGWCRSCAGKGHRPHGERCQACWSSGKCGHCGGSGRRIW